MRRGLIVAVLPFLAGTAWAGECGDAARELGDKQALVAKAPVDSTRQEAPGRAAAPSGDAATTSGDTGVGGVPNTGGVRTTRNSAPRPLTEEQRTAMRTALEAAIAADAGGDGTTCATRLAEARRIADGNPTGEPKAR